MRLSVGLTVALVALGRNLMRSVLAMVGLVIGVAAVLTMVALGRGASESVSEEVSSAGTNRIFVRAGNYTRGGDAVNIPSGYGKATSLTPADAEALSRVDGVEFQTPEVDDRARLSAGTSEFFASVLGCGPEVIDVYELELAAGRSFGPTETSASVVVLGSAVKDALFADDADPLGANVELEGQTFTVIGVLSPKDTTFDERVLMPVTTVQAIVGIDYLHGVTLATEKAGDASTISEALRTMLRERHGLDAPEREEDRPQATGDFAMQMDGAMPDDFTVETQAAKALTKGLYTTAAAFVLASMPRIDEVSSEEMVNTLTRANGTMTLLLAGIAAVSLVVGGIGIMNIMLLAVTERTMEVGLRMSVGARRRDVLSQFLMEAVLLSFLGGLVGIGFGYLSAGVLTQFLGWPTFVSTQAVLLAFGLAVAVGVVFGYYPALRASRLDPINALRYE